MFTAAQLSEMLIFDIETTSTTEKFTDLSVPMQEEWKKRCEYLRAMQAHPENASMTDDELWEAKAPLQAEFGRVVCISYGMLNLENPAEPKLFVNSYYGEDEIEILRKFAVGLEKLLSKNGKTNLVGHNIKRFDIPYLAKRMVINGIDLPRFLVVWNKKPWEMNTIDSSEVWGFNSWQEGFSSLNLISKVLNLPSPKEDMCGADVYRVYWKDKNYDRIKNYCEQGDVVSQARAMMRLANYSNSIIGGLQVNPPKAK